MIKVNSNKEAIKYENDKIKLLEHHVKRQPKNRILINKLYHANAVKTFIEKLIKKAYRISHVK